VWHKMDQDSNARAMNGRSSALPMRSRLTSGGVLLLCVAMAGITTMSLIAARIVQMGSLLLACYVAFFAWRGAETMRRARGRGTSSGVKAPRLPFVTVVVPARDEAPVIEAVVRDLASQVYEFGNAPHFEVLVVDDGSSDRTGSVAREVAAEFGGHVRVIRREAGDGPATRGAALNHATPYARGSIVAAIDADARVPPNFLISAISSWQWDANAGAMQVQRRSVGRKGSWLAGAQADEQLIDMCMQCWRWRTDGNVELRGNGMFIRHDLLERLGGWGAEALTEDLDTSTRLAALGERVTLAPEVSIEEQAVASIRALWQQRMRWAEGSMRRIISHGPVLIAAPIPLGRKLDFLSLVAQFVFASLFMASIAYGLIVSVMSPPADWAVPLTLLISFGMGIAPLAWAGLSASGRRGSSLFAGVLRATVFLFHWNLVAPAAMIRIALGPSGIRYVKTVHLVSFVREINSQLSQTNAQPKNRSVQREL